MKKLSLLLLTVLVLSCTKSPVIKFELPSVISDGMVLQRNTEVVLWGKASPSRKVLVTTSWGVKSAVRTNKMGQWQVKVKTGDAGGPYEIAFQAGDTSVTLTNVLLGEVWVCSGQSNMEMPVSGWPPNDTILNSAKEIAEANYPQIRLFTVARNLSLERIDKCNGSWSECSPRTIPAFSATAYFFGKNLYQKLGIPVGLIHTSWGGTPAEAWTSTEFLKDIPAYSNIIENLKTGKVEQDSLMAWMHKLESKIIDLNDSAYYSKLDIEVLSMADKNLDDSGWPVMKLPAFWEVSGLADFDGIVWFRKEFEVPAGMAGKEMILHLGPIDDMDRTFLNGEPIGEIMKAGFWKESRDYKIPAGKIKAGTNVLAVCVFDQTGGGGIYGPEEIKLTIPAKKQSILLNGDWKYNPIAQILGSEVFWFTKDRSFMGRPKVNIPIGSGTPSVLFNAMINPIIPFTMRGVIWYQGEANVGRGFEYRTLFPEMINCWRNDWDQGDFPFYYVQIAPWEYGDDPKSPAAELREAQLLTLSVPNTGMVVTMDIGNPVNIHPCNKEEVGRRLALWALAINYGYDTLVYSGPIYNSILVDGSKIIISFDYAADGLVAKGGNLTCFEVAGSDSVYYPAIAQIVDQTVVVTSEKVSQPVAVRYGWSATAEPNLFNTAGLPASPFRSDSWKRLSE
jgi:sialate O-acetylesterase